MTMLHKKLDRAKRAAESLSLDQLRALDAYLHGLLAALENAADDIPVKAGAEVVSERKEGNRTIRLMRIKCGKVGCRCTRGQLHGPYLYAYWRESGRLRSEYLGKPEEVSS